MGCFTAKISMQGLQKTADPALIRFHLVPLDNINFALHSLTFSQVMS